MRELESPDALHFPRIWVYLDKVEVFSGGLSKVMGNKNLVFYILLSGWLPVTSKLL